MQELICSTLYVATKPLTEWLQFIHSWDFEASIQGLTQTLLPTDEAQDKKQAVDASLLAPVVAKFNTMIRSACLYAKELFVSITLFTCWHILLNGRFSRQFLRWIAGDTKVTSQNTAGKNSRQKDMSLV